MNSSLRDVEVVFNAFAGVADQLDTLAKASGTPLREELAKAALFTFEQATCNRVFELARERGTSAPIEEAPIPFDRVILVDNVGAVFLHVIGETDDGDILRRMSVVVYLHHLNSAVTKQWMLLLGSVDYVNAEKLADAAMQGDIFSIDSRTPTTSNVIRLNGPLTTVLCDAGKLVVKQLPDVRPAMREAVIPAAPDENTVAAFITRDFITSLSSSMEQLWYANLPRHHIVEATPNHIAANPERYNRQAKAKAARFADRIRYLLVEPERVVEIRPPNPGSGDGTHASPVPHARAGYSKILRAARFKKKRWSVVHVRPTWVGDEEWDHSKVRYRVVAPGAKL